MKIIIADASSSMRRVIDSCLIQRGCQTLHASTSEELSLLLETPWEALIIDQNLNPANFIQMISNIRKNHPKKPIIVMAHRDRLDTSVSLMQLGITDCLVKPFSIDRFELALEKAIPQEKSATFEAVEGNEKSFLRLEQLPSSKKHQGMKRAVGLIQNVAPSDITIIITGESGVGKEIFAKSLHAQSLRKNSRFVGLNCASVPGNLLEAELFGVEKGAFTGAVSRRAGKFELANKGTLLLDEISEMDLNLQTKLLRVIQEKELFRVGGEEKVNLDVRLIATTNRDLREWVKEGHFREDLFYRLNVISIHVPPLRERIEDIPVLAKHFIDHFNRQNTGSHLSLSMEAMEQLCQYNWPGNIRELENILLRTAYLTKGKIITKVHFDANRKDASLNINFNGTLDDMERVMIHQALEANHGNRVHAAEKLGISVRTLRNKLRQYREEARDLAGLRDESTALTDLDEIEKRVSLN